MVVQCTQYIVQPLLNYVQCTMYIVHFTTTVLELQKILTVIFTASHLYQNQIRVFFTDSTTTLNKTCLLKGNVLSVYTKARNINILVWCQPSKEAIYVIYISIYIIIPKCVCVCLCTFYLKTVNGNDLILFAS